MSNALTNATSPQSGHDKFQQMLVGQRKGLITLAGDKAADRLLRLILVEGALNPKILECSRPSILRAVFLSAQLQLEPGAVKGELYFIPRGGELQVQLGYKGYLTLARRSGQITMVDAHIVYEGDEYELNYGTEPYLRHTPKAGVDHNADKVIAAYCVVKLKDGSTYFEWLWKDETDSRRNRSDGWRAYSAGKIKSTPWSTDYAAMARKTAIRALFTGGRVPMADQLGLAAAVFDEEAAPEVRNAALTALSQEMQAAAPEVHIDIPAVEDPAEQKADPAPAQ